MKRAVITAGGSGIGRTYARRLTAEGWQVAICDAAPEALAATGRELPGALARVVDVTSEPAMDAFLAEVEHAWGGVDLMCANAGTGGPAGRIETLDYGAWMDCLTVNLGGAFLACRWAARLMREAQSGLIVLTSSTAGLWGYPLRSPYAAAKWGVIGLTKTLASELGPAGVRVNAIAPGAVEGDRMDRVVAMEAAASGKSEEEVRAIYVKGTAMRTWVTEDDLADTLMFLASPAASRISGQVIAVDGHTTSLEAT